MSEKQEKDLMGLEKSLKILEDVVDVMAHIKQLVEDIGHHDVNVKRFKEMVKAPKEKKNSRRCRFGF
jgi:hypothetical protein